jgi:hypothetical protein
MTTGTENDDRIRELFAALPPDAAPTEDCPEPERIWRAVRGELAGDAFRGIADHTIACPYCTNAWRLARDVASGAGLVREQEPARSVKTRPGVAWWMAAAAAAVVAFVALTLELRRPSHPTVGEPAYRAGVEQAVRSLVPEGAKLPRERFVLRWTGPEGARYDLQVATEELSVLVEARGLAETEHRVAPGRLAELEPGATIVWQVEAVLPDGSRLTSVSFAAELE